MALKNTGRKASAPPTLQVNPTTPAVDAMNTADAEYAPRDVREHMSLVGGEHTAQSSRARSTTRRPLAPRDPNDELLTPQEVSAEYGISEANLATWRTRGGGPRFLRPRPRVIRYKRSSIVEWLGAEVSSTGEAKARAAAATN
jgi:hypothetical protein